MQSLILFSKGFAILTASAQPQSILDDRTSSTTSSIQLPKSQVFLCPGSEKTRHILAQSRGERISQDLWPFLAPLCPGLAGFNITSFTIEFTLCPNFAPASTPLRPALYIYYWLNKTGSNYAHEQHPYNSERRLLGTGS